MNKEFEFGELTVEVGKKIVSFYNKWEVVEIKRSEFKTLLEQMTWEMAFIEVGEDSGLQTCPVCKQSSAYRDPYSRDFVCYNRPCSEEGG